MRMAGNRKIETLRFRGHTPKPEEKLPASNLSLSISSGAISPFPPSNPQNVIYTPSQFCQYSKILLSFYWNHYFILQGGLTAPQRETLANFLATGVDGETHSFSEHCTQRRSRNYGNVEAGTRPSTLLKPWNELKRWLLTQVSV